MRRNFIRQKDFYYVNKCKMNCDIEVDIMKRKTRYDAKGKGHLLQLPRKGYLVMAVRSFYVDLQDIKADIANLQNT